MSNKDKLYNKRSPSGAKKLSASAASVVIPPSPESVRDLMRLRSDSSAGTSAVAKVAARDPAIAAALCKTAMSAAVNPSGRPVDSLNQACSMLGVVRACDIAVYLSLRMETSKFKEFENFWDQAATNSEIAYDIAVMSGACDPCSAGLTGLLMDVGVPLCSMRQGEGWMEKYKEAAVMERPDKTEEEIFGFSHSQIGGLACRAWGLPKDVCEAVLIHHDPEILFESGVAASLACSALIADHCRSMARVGISTFFFETNKSKLLSRVGLDESSLHELIETIACSP